ncbi:MAG: glycosyltransferase [Candidatus Zambryskibacteria bacterium]|nr:glycosyltransferase [Candidatus Zambryskibacteria bacterium]
MPETSIVIRTYNEEKHIGNLLRAIETQDYKDYEIIIIDSDSTDKTLEIAEKYPVEIIKIEKRDFTFGYALNVGCQASRGRYLVFASAHVLPATNSWLSHLTASFKDPEVAMVYGRQKGNADSKYSEQKDFWRLFSKTAVNSKVPLYYANNANAAIKKSIWEEERFDEYLFGLEDIDWTRRVTSKGLLIRYEPNAPVYHIHNETWPEVFNRYRREAIAAVRIGLPHPPQTHLGIWWLLLRISADIFGSSDWSFARLEEIFRFRYYQWKGSNLGWKQGKDTNFKIQNNNVSQLNENQAVVIKGKSKAKIEGISIPEMRPGDILIKVDYVGVCRTDIEVYEGTLGYYRDGIASHPIVPGHEFSGTIVKIGSNNKFQERFKLGQRVVGECILSRGKKSERKEVGVINYNGAYSKFIVMPGDAIHKIPDNIDSKTAVLTEPLAVILRALRRIESRLKNDSRIAVIGAGQIGNLCTQVLALRGYKVDLFDSDAKRLSILPNIANGTNAVIGDLDSFDVIIEATGSKAVLGRVLRESLVDSTMLLLGFPYGDMEYNFEDIVGKEKVVIGSVGAESQDFRKALELLSDLDMTPFVQVVMPLKNFEEAWQAHKSLKHLKILLQP